MDITTGTCAVQQMTVMGDANPIVLCGDCGAVIPVDRAPGSVTYTPEHRPRRP